MHLNMAYNFSRLNAIVPGVWLTVCLQCWRTKVATHLYSEGRCESDRVNIYYMNQKKPFASVLFPLSGLNHCTAAYGKAQTRHGENSHFLQTTLIAITMLKYDLTVVMNIFNACACLGRVRWIDKVNLSYRLFVCLFVCLFVWLIVRSFVCLSFKVCAVCVTNKRQSLAYIFCVFDCLYGNTRRTILPD